MTLRQRLAPGPRPRWAALVLALAAAVVVTLPTPIAARPPSGGPLPGSAPTGAGTNLTNITYNASTDGFPLSYDEQLPARYVASHSYPLLVYLHGKGKQTAWTPGGAGNGILGYISGPGPGGDALRGLLANASAYGFIFIAPSPRSASGFYTNSACGGPEEQDTLDAISHEESLRSISSIYVLGFSMGAIGGFSLVGHHPGMFAGLAVAGAITDAFEDFAYHPANVTGYPFLNCGTWPSPTATAADAEMTYLSVARYHPQNFSGVRVWDAAGGLDFTATDSASLWGYFQANDTFRNSTCLVAAGYGEPANCTTTFAQLLAAHPGQYPYRTVWEQTGIHLLALFDFRDAFQFLLGREKGGCFASTYPPTSLTPISCT